ncbi:MAG: RpiB/LacA/LacB family sugar-phosphate isomerase [Lachnospiraceae bacterium]|nr:RpiB/LacA/LacB family sugar-phosphate isomerase [Lachnospiraceae bacterium]
MSKKIIIAGEKSGEHLKNSVVKFMESKGYDFTDVTTEEPMSYIDAGSAVGSAISKKEYDLGIVICGSGMGVNLVANRYPGVYCGLVENVNTAKMARTITNCNVLAMGGNIVAYDLANKMTEAFVETEFGEGFPPEFAERLKQMYEDMEAVDKAAHGL